MSADYDPAVQAALDALNRFSTTAPGRTTPDSAPQPPSPLLQTLDRIADALESIAADVESLNRRDSVWRAS